MPAKEQIVVRLAEAPQRIATLTAGMTRAQLKTPPAPDAWSANDVLAHLRACSDMWGGHITAIATEDGLTRQGMNPRTWIKQTNYPELQFQPSLREYTRQRAELMVVLGRLAEDDWSRGATVMAWNIGHRRTLLSYAEQLARHERTHLKQIEQIAKST